MLVQVFLSRVFCRGFLVQGLLPRVHCRGFTAEGSLSRFFGRGCIITDEGVNGGRALFVLDEQRLNLVEVFGVGVQGWRFVLDTQRLDLVEGRVDLGGLGIRDGGSFSTNSALIWFRVEGWGSGMGIRSRRTAP